MRTEPRSAAVPHRLRAVRALLASVVLGLVPITAATLGCGGPDAKAPNPTRPLARGWDKVVASAKARWPEITVEAP